MPNAGLPSVRDAELRLRPAETPEAVRALAPLMADERVTVWWGVDAIADLVAELETVVLLELDGELAGVLQCHEETHEQFPSVSFDIAIDPARHGRRLGPRSLQLAMRHYAAAGHHRFVIDPALDNQPAVRAYERAGFRRVGIQRSFERTQDGRWRDGLLMEALAWEVPELAEVYTGPPEG